MERARLRIPDWLKVSVPSGGKFVEVKKIIEKNNLHTVCNEARCPNRAECFNCGTATFLILGDVCTRNCRYCSVKKGFPAPPDINEPEKIAEAIKLLKLKYAVITSVTRDDLPDGGAEIFARIVTLTRKVNPECRIELLIPDFKQSISKSLEKIIQTKPDVINHNIEAARDVYSVVRPMGDYDTSLKVIRRIAESGITAKSGMMLGFGESTQTVRSTIDDLKKSGCSILTIGQYMQSDKECLPVEKYYLPEEFDDLHSYAKSIGIKQTVSAPLVRSSYKSEELYNAIKQLEPY